MNLNLQRGFVFIPILIGAAVFVTGAFFAPTTIARYHASEGEKLLKKNKLLEAKQEYKKAADISQFSNFQDRMMYGNKTLEIGNQIFEQEKEKTYKDIIAAVSNDAIRDESKDWKTIYNSLINFSKEYSVRPEVVSALNKAKKYLKFSDTSNAAIVTTQIPYGVPKIDCTGPDGKHMQITQNECDDFNNAWKNHNPGKKNVGIVCQIVPGQSIQARDQVECDRARTTFPGYNTAKYNASSSEPLVNCVLSYGTFKLYQGTCDQYKSQDTYVQSEQTSDEEFQRTMNDLNSFANQDFNAEYEKSRQQGTTQTVATDLTAYNNCMSQARSAYQGEEQRAIATGLGNSAGAFMLNAAKSNFDKAAANCNLYPH